MRRATPARLAIRLAVVAKAAIWSVNSGWAAVTDAMPAAIMEPEPTPDPIASASQRKMFSEETTEATRLTMMAPKIEPKTYIESTPRYCGSPRRTAR